MFDSSVCERVMPVGFTDAGKERPRSSFLSLLVLLEAVACDGLKSVAVAYVE